MDKKWIIVLLAVILILFASDTFDYFSDNQNNPIQATDQQASETPEVTAPEVNKKTDDQEQPDSNNDQLISAVEITYEVETIAENLNIPWDLKSLPDGRLLITERPGNVILLDGQVIYQVHNVQHIGEGGLLGLALSPDFEQNKYVYLYYTYEANDQIMNKVSRFKFQEDTFQNEEVIIDQIPGSRFHNGGRIKFGPDGKLYITTGDAQNPNLAQNLGSLAGKILRLNPDGTIPKDNPFDNSPVYAYGVRNPQGIAWHPKTKQLYASGHGPSSQDEVNLIKPGMNYGWPIVTCRAGETDYEDPITCYSDFTLAPSGIDFLSIEGLSEYPLMVAGLRGNMIMRLDFDATGDFIRQEAMFQEYGRLRTVEYHQGYLYVLTNNTDGRGSPQSNDDRILKIKPILKMNLD